MCFFFSFIPATLWVVIGYFVLFASTKAEGAIQTFGQILAIWVFVIAAVYGILMAWWMTFRRESSAEFGMTLACR